MSKKIIRLVLLGVIVMVTCGSSSLRACESYQDEYTEEFEFAPGGQFNLTNVSGTISISGTDEDRVSIRAVKVTSKAENREEAERLFNKVNIELNKTERTVDIKTSYPKRKGSFFIDEEKYPVPHTFTGKISRLWDVLVDLISGDLHFDFGSGFAVEVNYEIKLPSNTGLEVNNVNGKIDIQMIEGDVEVQVVNGDLGLDRLKGNIEANLVNGSMRAKEINGSVETNNINGSIDVEIDSAEGKISAECNLVNGDAIIRIDESAALDLELSTLHGNVKVEWLVNFSGESSRKKITGELNGGGPRIGVKIVNGDIKVCKK